MSNTCNEEFNRKAHVILERLEEVNERIDECQSCPFYGYECEGDPRKTCFLEDVYLSFEAMLEELEANDMKAEEEHG